MHVYRDDDGNEVSTPFFVGAGDVPTMCPDPAHEWRTLAPGVAGGETQRCDRCRWTRYFRAKGGAVA